MTKTRRFALGALAASILLAGQTAQAEITDNEIRIGYLADMSSPWGFAETLPKSTAGKILKRHLRKDLS